MTTGSEGHLSPVRSALRHARVDWVVARMCADRRSRDRLRVMLLKPRRDVPGAAEELSIRALGAGVIWVRPGSSDPDVAVGALHGRYHLPKADLGSPKLIWDLGCNIGLTMRQMGAAYPQARIIGVDLDPENLSLAERNIAPIADRCELIEGAIWPRQGELAYTSSNGEDAYRIANSGDCRTTAITLDSLLARFGPPDYVKMDIEGAESEVLSNATDWAASVPRMSVEYHAPYALADCERDLGALGFGNVEAMEHGLLRRGSDTVYATRSVVSKDR